MERGFAKRMPRSSLTPAGSIRAQRRRRWICLMTCAFFHATTESFRPTSLPARVGGSSAPALTRPSLLVSSLGPLFGARWAHISGRITPSTYPSPSFSRLSLRAATVSRKDEVVANEGGRGGSGEGGVGGAAVVSEGRYGLAALSTRAQRLRELLTAKEIRNDLTEAEFALTLANSATMMSDFRGQADRPQGANSIDFETLMLKLSRHELNLEERRAALPLEANTELSTSTSNSNSGPSQFKAFAGLTVVQLDELLRRVSDTTRLLREFVERRDRERAEVAAAAAAAAAEAEAVAMRDAEEQAARTARSEVRAVRQSARVERAETRAAEGRFSLSLEVEAAEDGNGEDDENEDCVVDEVLEEAGEAVCEGGEVNAPKGFVKNRKVQTLFDSPKARYRFTGVQKTVEQAKTALKKDSPKPDGLKAAASSESSPEPESVASLSPLASKTLLPSPVSYYRREQNSKEVAELSVVASGISSPMSSSSSSSSLSSDALAKSNATSTGDGNSCGGKGEESEESESDLNLSRLRTAFNATVIEEKLAIYVRDDGTVDVEKAVETGREVVRFSAELWERLNGKSPEGENKPMDGLALGMGGGGGGVGGGEFEGPLDGGTMNFDAMLRAVERQPTTVAARRRLVEAQRGRRRVEKERRVAAEQYAIAEKQKKMANNANNANWDLGGFRPKTTKSRQDRSKNEQPGIGFEYDPLDDPTLKRQKRSLRQRERASLCRARLAALDYDMERSCGVLALEIEQASAETFTTSWRAEQRRLVAEFGLLDAQLAVLLSVLQGSYTTTTAATANAATAGIATPAPVLSATAATTATDTTFGAVPLAGGTTTTAALPQQDGEGASSSYLRSATAVKRGGSASPAAVAAVAGDASNEEFRVWVSDDRQQTPRSPSSVDAAGPSSAWTADNDNDERLLARIDSDELDVVATQVVELVQNRIGIKPTDPETFMAGAGGSLFGGVFGEGSMDWAKQLARRKEEDEKREEDEEDEEDEFGQQGLFGGGVMLPSLDSLLRLERIGKQWEGALSKVASGVEFYVLGTRLLGDDMQYAGTLLGKAMQGTTLSQREARTLRRTGKDLVTVVPVIVILVIPLTPVGHVLVFSFIQRIFPDFFPSTYTERRQNLLKLYEAIAPQEDDGPNRKRF